MKRFVASGVRTVNRDSKTVWLGLEEGYHQWTEHFDSAQPFETKDEAEEAAKDSTGPWFNLPDKQTLQIVEVEYTPATEAKITLCA